MASDSKEDDMAAYKAAVSASFFDNEKTDDARKPEERRRGREAGKGVQTNRRPLQRTEHIGIRTTPDMKSLIQSLGVRLSLKTATEVIERAVLDLDKRSKTG